jgi:hypothetical protein
MASRDGPERRGPTGIDNANLGPHPGRRPRARCGCDQGARVLEIPWRSSSPSLRPTPPPPERPLSGYRAAPRVWPPSRRPSRLTAVSVFSILPRASFPPANTYRQIESIDGVSAPCPVRMSATDWMAPL